MLTIRTVVTLVMLTAFVAMTTAIWAAQNVLLIGGWVSAETALRGFSSPALHTIAVLLAISSGVRHSGALTAVSRVFFGQQRPRGPCPSADDVARGAAGAQSTALTRKL